ncbi:hypothetical protein BKA69DRAFT_1077163, partial [Paraphysoderma sedebokerense]
ESMDFAIFLVLFLLLLTCSFLMQRKQNVTTSTNVIPETTIGTVTSDDASLVECCGFEISSSAKAESFVIFEE